MIFARSIALLFCAASVFAQDLPTYQVVHAFGIPDNGVGRPAREASVISPIHVTGDAEGNVFVGYVNLVFRIDAQTGIYSLAAGNGSPLSTGDGGLATEAGFSQINGLAVHGDSLYIAHVAPCGIRRVDLSSGIVETVAGTGACPGSLDPDPFAGPVASTAVNPLRINVDAQGRLLFASRNRVGRIDFGSQMIELVAGEGFGDEGDGGPAVDAQLRSPSDVLADAEGNIYIAEFNGRRIRKVDAATGDISIVAGTGAEGNSGDGGPAVEANLERPVDLAIDSTGTKLYFGGLFTNTIRVVDLAAGTIDRFAGGAPGGSQLEDAPALETALFGVGLGLWVNPNDELVFTDARAHTVLKVTDQGIITRIAGRPQGADASPLGDSGPAQTASITPREVLVTPSGRVLITGVIQNRVREVKDGLMTTIAGTGAFSSTGDGGLALEASFNPGRMAADAQGVVYLHDNLSNLVRRILPDGTIDSLGTLIPANSGLAVRQDGTLLYRSQSGQHRVVVENFTDLAFPVAGTTGSPGFSGDGGPADQAQLSSPQGLAIDADNNLYICDLSNKRVRMVAGDTGIITTIAGNGMDFDVPGGSGPATGVGVGFVFDCAVDLAGNVIFTGGTAAGESAILRLDRASNTVHVIAGGPGAGVPITRVFAVDVDERGVIYVSDTGNNRILALVPSNLEGPYITGLITPASFGAGDQLAPGGWVEVYGVNLAGSTTDWSQFFNGGMAPTTIDGTSLSAGGSPSAISFVGPGQVNGQVGDGVMEGNTALQVTNALGSSNVVALSSAQRAGSLLAPPSFATADKQYVAALLDNGSAFAGPPGLIAGANFRRAKAGDVAVLYGVGFGGVTPNAPSGNIVNGTTALPNVTVTLGGQEVQVAFAGLTPGLIGLYQFNIVVPAGVSGDVLLEITVDGVTTTQVLCLAVE